MNNDFVNRNKLFNETMNNKAKREAYVKCMKNIFSNTQSLEYLGADEEILQILNQMIFLLNKKIIDWSSNKIKEDFLLERAEFDLSVLKKMYGITGNSVDGNE